MKDNSEQPAGTWASIKEFFVTLAWAATLLIVMMTFHLAIVRNSLFYMGLALAFSFVFCKEHRKRSLVTCFGGNSVSTALPAPDLFSQEWREKNGRSGEI